jgi:hypothetical protein
LSVTAANPDSTAEQQNAVGTVFSLSYFYCHQRYIIFKNSPLLNRCSISIFIGKFSESWYHLTQGGQITANVFFFSAVSD